MAGYAAVLVLAACAPASVAPAAPAPASARPATGRATGSADCTKASKVAIAGSASSAGGDTVTFSPGKLTIRRGGFLAVTNRSDEVYDLVPEPDAGIVKSVIDRRERQVVQFPRAGTFTVRTPGHRATLKVTVAGESGCGTPEPTLTITDGYAFTPAAVTVHATENFTVVNKSRSAQTVTCDPDPGGNRDHSRLDQGETQILAIDEPGRYACASVQHPAAKVTVTVDGD